MGNFETRELLPTQEKEPINKRILIKIGSSSLVKDRQINEALNAFALDSIAYQISEHIDRGGEAIIVTSGAVAAGRWRSNVFGLDHKSLTKQYLASVGQPVLMEYWQKSFEKYKKLTGQILVTDRDISKILDLTTEYLKSGSIPIINANDAVDTVELDALNIARDNDQLATHIALQARCNGVVYLTNVAGVLGDNNEILSNGDLINVNSISQEKSLEGTGGMYSKVAMAFQLRDYGIHSVIASRDNTQVVRQLAAGLYEEIEGTLFKAYEN